MAQELFNFHHFKSAKKKTLTGLFLFFTCFILNAQISGIAVNDIKEPVAFATVILKTAHDSSIAAFIFNLTLCKKVTHKKLGFFLVS